MGSIKLAWTNNEGEVTAIQGMKASSSGDSIADRTFNLDHQLSSRSLLGEIDIASLRIQQKRKHGQFPFIRTER